MSPASAKVALTSRAVLNPLDAVTTISPPSVSIRRTKRIPDLVGFARVRVSVVVDTISQIWRSLETWIVPPLPGSVSTFGPRYRSWWILRGAVMRNILSEEEEQAFARGT